MEATDSRRLAKLEEVTRCIDFFFCFSWVIHSHAGVQSIGTLVMSSGLLMHPNNPNGTPHHGL
jgi:hypothetical protein